jgi:hypothetical protein
VVIHRLAFLRSIAVRMSGRRASAENDALYRRRHARDQVHAASATLSLVSGEIPIADQIEIGILGAAVACTTANFACAVA